MLRHAVNHDSTTKREEGFLEGLRKAAPSIEFLSIDQRGGVSIDEAMKVSESLLNQFADQIDGVFTPNESTTLTVPFSAISKVLSCDPYSSAF